MEAQFRNGKSRHLLWPQIYSNLKAADPETTETLKNVQKKFNNMMLTYKRIKSSSRNSSQSKWEFFEDFDEILSQFSESNDGNDPTNVRYVKVEQIDDDSVSFSSDDDTPTNYRNVAAYKESYKQELPIEHSVVYDDQTANGIKPEEIVVPVPEIDTKKRKLMPAGDFKVLKKTKSSTVDPTDDKSWFREYVIMSERKEQRRHEQLLEMERKRLEIETKNMQMLRELVDVVKKFVNK